MSELTQSPAWIALESHYSDAQKWHMRELFERNPNRMEAFTTEAAGLTLDFSKNIIDDKTLALLNALLKQQAFDEWRDKLFLGRHINHTEDRAVLHTALRRENHDDTKAGVDVREAQQKLSHFTQAVHDGEYSSATGEKFTHVVNIGIGGSDLGPRMVVGALKDYELGSIKSYFVSNVDPVEISDVLSVCPPETTLFVIVSKTFTTTETLRNAEIAKAWLLESVDENNFHRHFVGVSANVQIAQAFGISEERVFPMWDWVGGRYSVWSAVGLSVMLAIGVKHFEQFMSGANAMDRHFLEAPLHENMPVILALLGIWYNNFFKAETVAVLPYSQRLSHLPSYLQQLDMESNGKSIDRDGNEVDYQTGPIVWGAPGTNGQHAFYQLIHQGTKLIPADFIGLKESTCPQSDLHTVLNANYIAQMEALMTGKSPDQEETVYQLFKGNKPSNAIFMDKMTPRNLGALIALYEHKVFVQGVVWNINSFDQWGVEYGKQLAKKAHEDLVRRDERYHSHDSSTRQLISKLK